MIKCWQVYNHSHDKTLVSIILMIKRWRVYNHSPDKTLGSTSSISEFVLIRQIIINLYSGSIHNDFVGIYIYIHVYFVIVTSLLVENENMLVYKNYSNKSEYFSLLR